MQNAAVAPPHHDPTCLIVEDSHFDQMMMRRVIDRSGADVNLRHATSLQAARVALATHPISMIVLDNSLPDGTGVNFALELAEMPSYANIPVVMVSDWPTPFMWDKATKAGVLSVVNKSEFTVPFFLSTLQRSLNTRAPVSYENRGVVHRIRSAPSNRIVSPFK